jgi:hypothetical protein
MSVRILIELAGQIYQEGIPVPTRGANTRKYSENTILLPEILVPINHTVPNTYLAHDLASGRSSPLRRRL